MGVTVGDREASTWWRDLGKIGDTPNQRNW